MYKRNDPCPCGSGKKYKKCCAHLNLTPQELWKQRATTLSNDNIDSEVLVNTFFAVFNHSIVKGWTGSCHAVSSILHILLKEQGINSKLNIGFVKADKIPFPFCHSWITVNNLIYDIGLYRSNSLSPFTPYIEVSAPIFKSVNVESGEKTPISFGVSTSRMDFNYQLLTTNSLGEYMDGWPAHKDGLWGEIVEVAARIGINANKFSLTEKYYEEQFQESHISIS